MAGGAAPLERGAPRDERTERDGDIVRRINRERQSRAAVVICRA